MFGETSSSQSETLCECHLSTEDEDSSLLELALMMHVSVSYPKHKLHFTEGYYSL